MAPIDEIYKATYALEFKDLGLSSATMADKRFRDSVKQTSAAVSNSATAAVRSGQQVAVAQVAQKRKIDETANAWREAASAAVSASSAVAKAQQRQATVVASSVSHVVEELRKARVSYSDIVKTMSDYRVAAGQVSAAVTRSSRDEVEQLNKVIDVRNKMRQAVGLAPTVTGRRGGEQIQHERSGLERGVLAGVSTRLRSGAGYITGGLVGGLAGYLSVAGIKNSIETTTQLSKAVQFLTTVTGLSQQQAASWVAVAQSNNVSVSMLAQTFHTLGNGAERALRKTSSGLSTTAKATDHLAMRTAAALGGTKASEMAFSKLGITQQQVASRQNNMASLFSLVTGRLAAMKNGAEKTALSQQLLGNMTGKAAKQSTAAVQAFKDLGISQGEIRANSKNMSDLLGLVADRLQKMPPGLAKTRDEAALFGRSYQRLTPLIANGAKGMEEARKQAEAYGITMGGNATENAHKLEEAQVNLRMASLGLQVQFAEHLAPTIIKMIGAVIKLANSARQVLSPVFHAVVHDVKDVVHWFGENKVALDALIATAGTVGGLFILSKTLQTLGRLARGVSSDWGRLKTGVGVIQDLLSGSTYKLSQALNDQTVQEELAQKQAQALADMQDYLAKTFGVTTAAADAATASITRMGAASEAAAAVGGGPGGLSRVTSLPGTSTGLSRAEKEAAALRAGTGGIAGGASEASQLSTVMTQNVRQNGLVSGLYGKVPAANIARQQAQAAAQAAKAGPGAAAGMMPVVAAEGGLTAAEGSKGLMSKLGGFASRTMGSLGVAGMGLGLSQLAGLIPGKTGQTVSQLGMGASIGAGIGSMIAPGVGTAIGAGLGALSAGLIKIFGSGGQSYGQGRASAIYSKGFGGAQAGTLAAQTSKALDTLHHLETKTTTTMGPRGSRMQTTQQIDYSKLNPYQQRQAMVAANKAGSLVAQQLEAGWNQYKFQSEPIMFTQLRSKLKSLPPEAQASSVSSAIKFAQGLEKQGRLAKGSTQFMLRQVEGEFPGFERYMGLTGQTSMATFNKAMDFTKTQANVKASLTKVGNDFSPVQQAVSNTAGTVQDKTRAALQSLETLASGTGKQAQSARADIRLLKSSASADLDALTAKVVSAAHDQQAAISQGSQQAAANANTNFQNYVKSVQSAMASGAIAVKQGNQELAKALNATLKAFGASPLPASVLANSSIPSLAAYGNWATHGARGTGSGIGKRAVGGWVPGDPHSDSTLALLAGNEFVVTGHGQQMMEAMAPGMLDALARHQMPHFAKGGPTSSTGQLTAPVVHAPGGTIGREAQGALNLATKAANAKIAKIEAQMNTTSTGGGSVGSANVSGTGQRSWARSLLSDLGYKVTPNAVNDITAWENQEGGNWNNSARFNPLNTTMGAAGATSMNSVGVKAYTSWGQGMAATIATLKNGNYGGILAALRAGAPLATFEAAVNASPWGTKFRDGGFFPSFQNGGFTANAVHSLPGGWTYGTPGTGHHRSSTHPTGLSQVTVPGTGVKGILAQHEYVNRGSYGGSTYKGLPVVTQHEYDLQKQAYQLHHAGGVGGAKGKTGPHWVRTGATLDPTYAAAQSPAGRQYYNGGMSYAELEATPGFPNYAGGGIRKLLEGTQGGTGLPFGFAILARPLGSSGPGIRLLKSDVGDGAGNAPHSTVDLHPAASKALGGISKSDIEIALPGTPSSAGFTGTAGKATTLVPGGKGIGDSPFYQGYQYGLDNTTGLSPAAALQAATLASQLVAKTTSTSTGAGSVSGVNASVGGVSGGASGLQASMMMVANHFMGKPYNAAGGAANGRPPNMGASALDCSALVSAIINLGGKGVLPPVPTNYTTDQLKTWGLPGNGKQITVGVRGTSGGDAHTMMNFFGKFAESSHPGKGPHWDSGWSEDFPIRRHPPGYRRGGKVGMSPHPKAHVASRWNTSKPTPNQYTVFDRIMQSSWGRLSGRKVLPAWAKPPPYVIEPGPRSGDPSPNTQKPWIHFPYSFVHAAESNSPDFGWAMDAITHETAHTMQNAATLAQRWTREGGAQAWTDEYGTGGSADGPYAGFVRQVRKQKGYNWINHGQFARFARGGSVRYNTGAWRNKPRSSWPQTTFRSGGGVKPHGRSAGSKAHVGVSHSVHAPHTVHHSRGFHIGTSGARAAIQLPANLTLPAEPSIIGPLSGMAGTLADIINQMPAAAVSLGIDRTSKAVNATITKAASLVASSSDNKTIGDAMTRLSGIINDTSKTSYDTLANTADAIQKEIGGLGVTHTRRTVHDRHHMRHGAGGRHGAETRTIITTHTRALTAAEQQEKVRLTQEYKLVEVAMGQRVGALVKGAVNEQTALDTAQTALTNLMTRENISSTSAQGTQMMEAYQGQVVSVMQDSVNKLQTAYQLAVKAGDNKAAGDIAGKLQTALTGLDTATATLVQDHIATVEATAQQFVDAASHNATMASTGEQNFQLKQQIAGTDQTPGGGAAMGAYIKQNVIPVLQQQMTALQGQQQAAQSVGDSTLANQIAEAIGQQQNSILQAQLDAQNAIKTATQQTAVNTSNLTGQLGVSFQNETFPDLAGMLNGA